MRKRLITPIPEDSAMTADDWLDVAELAQVEVTSEDGAHLIESALAPGDGSGWRAAQPGEQTIRLIFDRPQRLTRIWLLFIEPAITRTQEFVLRWSPDGGRTFRDIVRQQWNFGSPETIREVEDYRVELSGVTAVELAIIPDQRGGDARASLAQLRLEPARSRLSAVSPVPDAIASLVDLQSREPALTVVTPGPFATRPSKLCSRLPAMP